MEQMKVSELIEALTLVGDGYRNKAGSKPADAVVKLIEQLRGAEDLSLREWVKSRLDKPLKVSKKLNSTIENDEMNSLANALSRLESHAAIDSFLASLSLSAPSWRMLAKYVTGKGAPTGIAAKQAIEAHYSNRLLATERVESVKRQFR